MLKVNQISKIYTKNNKQIKAIDNVSAEIHPGDFISLVGPSGSGKSSLLLMMGGMLSPTQGDVFIDGQSLYDLSADEISKIRQEKIGFIFQTFNLIPYLTAMQNVQMPLLLRGMDSKQQHEKAVQLLEKVGLSDRMHHEPAELSVGQQQRIALARMLANDPSIILADEPTGNLDPSMSQHVIQFLCELNREGRTIVMVTHDMQVASHAKRRFTLVDGKIVEENIRREK
jgi:putative ABC transport system ATP-binding protein